MIATKNAAVKELSKNFIKKCEDLTMKTFSEKVSEARNLRKLSQMKLAEMVGVSDRAIKSYEKGEKYPRRSTMYKLARALQVSTTYLSDDSCEDPVYEIEKDTYLETAQSRYGASGVRDVDRLLQDNAALFAGGELSQEQKDAFFQAVMTAYVTSKEAAKEKFGHSN